MHTLFSDPIRLPFPPCQHALSSDHTAPPLQGACSKLPGWGMSPVTRGICHCCNLMLPLAVCSSSPLPLCFIVLNRSYLWSAYYDPGPIQGPAGSGESMLCPIPTFVEFRVPGQEVKKTWSRQRCGGGRKRKLCSRTSCLAEWERHRGKGWLAKHTSVLWGRLSLSME